ncbi:hypothetical protein [Flaviaesturariibacter aridisoli]|uniref:hypothetical protein n=1 Tax=Flaviaesturariibacter aridisoli TaxID=2545761 RepID=UPI001404717E|nr:hypothetical protein [Flaviaesturariibacter aridisoli]
MQYEEERRNELLAGLLYRLLGLGIGLLLAAGLIAGLYETYRTDPPENLPATADGGR